MPYNLWFPIKKLIAPDSVLSWTSSYFSSPSFCFLRLRPSRSLSTSFWKQWMMVQVRDQVYRYMGQSVKLGKSFSLKRGSFNNTNMMWGRIMSFNLPGYFLSLSFLRSYLRPPTFCFQFLGGGTLSNFELARRVAQSFKAF